MPAQQVDTTNGLDDSRVIEVLTETLENEVRGQHLLLLIPDGTRTALLPRLFPLVMDALRDASRVDVMVALGTHPPLSSAEMDQLLGSTEKERSKRWPQLSLSNHAWSDPNRLTSLGVIPRSRLAQIAGDYWHPTLGGELDVRINRAATEVDRIVILGPVFPHEVAGFSGGTKYLFPGISGPEMINVSHWLGALVGVRDIIGIQSTPVRTLIDEAAAMLSTPVSLIAMIVRDKRLTGLFGGGVHDTWAAAVELCRTENIVWLDHPLHNVISHAAPIYKDLWTGGKAMYKLDPALADRATLTIYAPHLTSVSEVHGDYIRHIGYHVLPYFLEQWDRFSDVPLGVLAHSTHVKGSGTFVRGIETPRVDVRLATGISPEECRQLNLGYVDPTRVDPSNVPEGVTLIPNAGETLYRVKSTPPHAS